MQATHATPASDLVCDRAALARWLGRRQAFSAADAAQRDGQLRTDARHIRREILTTIHAAGLGHVGGDLSVTDILVTLFGGVLRIDPGNPAWAQRDRFILSKGHCAAALYAVLAHCGFFPRARLADFAAPMSPLNGHPSRCKVPGVETSTGPLGHGLPVGAGCATAARMAGQSWRTFVVLGDGELQEGSNWEAAMYAAQQGLEGLTAIVDRNRLQQGASTAETNDLEPLADKWTAFGWETHVVDGHCFEQLQSVLARAPCGRPRAVIANTVKGKGVSFMENAVEWHHKVPDRAQFESAMKELAP